MITDSEIACSSPAGLAYIHSKGQWVCPPHIGIINEKLLDIAAGRCKRLIISLPPRHGKSELISKYFPAWVLGTYPTKRVILASYEASFAATWGGKARDVLMQSQHHFNVYPEGGYKSSAQHWRVRKGGEMFCGGAGGPLTGKGFNIGIVDDLVKNNEEAMSATIREKQWDWFLSTFLTRAEPDAAIVIIMTRWHDDDIAGRLLREQKGQWENIVFPALAEGEDVLGRKEGDPLWPERFNAEDLGNIKKNLGSYWWAAMYQQRPAPEGGGLLKRDWWKWFKVAPLKIRQSYWSWDTANKTGEENDYSVGQLWAVCDDGYYLLKQVRARMEYPDLKRTIVQQFNAHPSNAVLIEDKSSGQSVIQDLRRDTRLPILTIEPVKDKVTRAHLASPIVESGRCHLPEDAPWVADYIDETTHFPKAAHDDQVDCTTQFLNYIAARPVINSSSMRAGGKLSFD